MPKSTRLAPVSRTIALIADVVREREPGLDLQRLHDQVWVNGNVPIALLRWELLGLTDELAALDVDAGQPAALWPARIRKADRSCTRSPPVTESMS